MCKLTKKNIIAAFVTALVVASILPANSESLFRAGVSQSVSPVTPRSYYAGMRATMVGDLVTILIDEKSSVSNSISLKSNKKNSVTDNWSSILDKILPGKGVVPNVDGWGGSSDVSNSATIKRANELSQVVMAQVVQVLPNGNLVVQAKKSIVNSGERNDIILSGIVNPRLIDGNGQISSQYVANLQLAIVGKGTVSRSESDGVMNKFLRLLF
ncbi:MAG: flagellar basal body L-ring protein FlgH [Vampirovibrionia bacterium]